MSDKAKAPVLSYRAPEIGRQVRFPMAPKRKLGWAFVALSLVGLTLLCICGALVVDPRDQPVYPVWLLLAGASLAMLIFPGLGLVFHDPNSEDRG